MPRPYGRPVVKVNADAYLSITGVEELDRQLRNLAHRDAQRIGRRAVSAALKITSQYIKSRVPEKKVRRYSHKSNRWLKVRYKRMSRVESMIRHRIPRSVTKGLIEGKAGIGVGMKLAKVRTGPAPHAHLIALGTQERQRKRFAAKADSRSPFARIKQPTPQQLRTGRMRPDDFVTQGFNAARRPAEAAMRREVERGLREHFLKEAQKA